jgi:hypothetical protein
MSTRPSVAVRPRALLALAITTITLLALALATPAQAAIVDRDRFTADYEFSIDDECDFEIRVEGSVVGHYRIRQGKPEETATPFYLHERFRWQETLHGNDTTIHLSGNEVGLEIRARYHGDALFEFDRMFAGQVTVRDAAGRLLFRDRGSLLFTYVFDKRDHPREPGGEFVELVDVQVRGPHPFFNLSQEEFCALFE